MPVSKIGVLVNVGVVAPYLVVVVCAFFSLGVGVDLTSSAYGGVMLLFLDLPFSECYSRGTIL